MGCGHQKSRRRKPSQPFLMGNGKGRYVFFPATADYLEVMAALDDMLLTETLKDPKRVNRAHFQVVGRFPGRKAAPC